MPSRPMLVLAVAVLLGGACTGSGTFDDTAGTDTGAPEDTADTGEFPPADTSDEAVIRSLIDGSGPALHDALARVAWSGGFPVATDDGTFLFVVETSGGATWQLAGDFNGWSPAPMTPGEGFAWLEVPLEEPAGQRYKFTRGDTWIADPWARSYAYDEFGEISFVRPPAAHPRLDRWPGVRGQGLRPRDLVVRVPPGQGPWPVVYAHDGQNLFDPAALHGGWRLDAELEALDVDVLLVGVHNTADRLDEYAHTTDVLDGQTLGGEADAYAALIGEQIRPHVEASYGSTGLDGVLGSSMGGLVSLYVAHAQPGAWDFAASLSGTLGWGRFGAENPTIGDLYAQAGVRDTVLYVDSGGGAGGDGCVDVDGDGAVEDDPDDADNYCTTRAFADRMAALGYSWGDDLHHWHEPGATHDEAAWAARVHRPLERFVALAAP